MAGKTPQDPDSLEPLWDALRGIRSQIRTLQQPTGTSLVGLVNQVQQAIANIGTAVTVFLSSGFTTGSMTATGNVQVNGNSTTNGTSRLVGTVTSPGVAGTNVTLLPGSRSIVYVVDATGVVGQTTSSIRFKTNLEEIPYTAEQFLNVMPLMFQYIGQIAIREDPTNENYDPDYVVPIEVGMVAEHLVDAGLELYVLFEADGVTPTNIDYPTFGAHAALVIGRDHARQLADLSRRLDAAGI